MSAWFRHVTIIEIASENLKSGPPLSATNSWPSNSDDRLHRVDLFAIMRPNFRGGLLWHLIRSEISGWPGESTRIHLALGGLVNEAEWGGFDFGAQWIMADGVRINQCGSWSASIPKKKAHSPASRFTESDRLFSHGDQHRRGVGPFYDSRRRERVNVSKERARVKAKQTMHVLTDKKGAIVGGGLLTPARITRANRCTSGSSR